MTDFSLSAGRRVIGDYAVYPNSLLFTAGIYADKGLTMSEGDIAAAAAGFLPVDFNVEHSKHGAHQALAGAFGGILKAWPDPDDPKNLRGEVAIPLWLDERLEKKSPSLEFTRDDKRIVGAALTYTPRVSEAALMSAVAEFAQTEAAEFGMPRHNTPEGQTTIQQIHDTAARSGAVCDRKNIEMSSAHEATAIQKIHDVAASHGATCSKGELPVWAKSMFSAIHPVLESSQVPLTTQPNPASKKSAKGEKTMLETIKALFTKAGVPAGDLESLTEADFNVGAPAITPIVAPVSFSDSPEAKAMLAEIETLKAGRQADFAASVAKDAQAFADSMVADSRAYPAEKPALVAAFAQAAKDDAASPAEVHFTSGTDTLTVSRVDALKALYAARPAHGLTLEQLTTSPVGAQVLAAFSGGKKDDGKLDSESRRLMLTQTELGRKMLADEARTK